MKVITTTLLIAFASLTGCKKHTTPTPPSPPDYTPQKATVKLPANNEVCNSGSPIGTDSSRVSFQWLSSSNPEEFRLHIKNLNTEDSLVTAAAQFPWLDVPLRSNTPYSWYVVTMSTKTFATAKSDTWKFYNSGSGITSHAPFPAEIISPAFGETIIPTAGKITLKWTGSDVDNDITGYDVYFGTIPTPAIRESSLKSSELANVEVVSGTTYYWKIITRDDKKNTSESGVYQFTVK